MNGLPVANYATGPSRFSISVSHPASQADATLYAGFDWYGTDGSYHQAEVFKTTNAGASWAQLPGGTLPDNVEDYCATQCWYDNVIEADPTNPNVVFAAGGLRLRARRGWHLPLDRRWPDVDQPRLRPAPRLPRGCLRPVEHAARADRLRRRRLVQRRSRWAADPGRPAFIERLAGPERHRRPRPPTPEPATGSGSRSSRASVQPDPARPHLGRQPGQRHRAASRLVRRQWFDSSAATVARCWSTRTTGIRVRHVLRHLARTATTRRAAAVLLLELVHPQRHQPERPGRVLRPRG